jgi:hypothetical protein
MSVRKSEREQGKLEVLTTAMEMCVYTLTLCKSQECFPKNQRWLLTSKIANEAVDVISCISKANSVFLKDGYTTKEDCKLRRSKQIEAKTHLSSLFTLMRVASEMNGIEERKIEHWTELAVNTEKLLSEWMRSDMERIKKFKNIG